MHRRRRGLILRCALTIAVAGAACAVATPASATPTVVSIPMPTPTCCPTNTVTIGGSVFVLSQQFGGNERATLVRIDPATDTITGQLRLLAGTPTGNALNTESMTVAAGSIWIPAYSENQLLRINPATMRVMARIDVGRSPDSITFDGSSLWLALQNDRAVARVDPRHNTVAATVAVGGRNGADGPFQLAFDGTQVLVSLPGSGRVARIDPRTARVRYDAVGQAAAQCAHILPAPGGYWLDDTECSFSYFRWDAATRSVSEIGPSLPNDFGAVVVGNFLYTGEFACGDTSCGDGTLVKRDVISGAEITRRALGDDASLPHFADGSFWVGDWNNGAIQRVRPF